VQALFKVLGETETDFTLFFRSLASVEAPVDDLYGVFYDKPSAGLRAWLERYLARARADESPWENRKQRMNAVNPKYVPRNYLAQQAIDAMAQGDASVLDKLMKVLERPYDEQPQHEAFAARRPEWARHKAGCSALSCSS
jgi:uncharacterized protein YdiU (UPF0061 family)